MYIFCTMYKGTYIFCWLTWRLARKTFSCFNNEREPLGTYDVRKIRNQKITIFKMAFSTNVLFIMISPHL